MITVEKESSVEDQNELEPDSHQLNRWFSLLARKTQEFSSELENGRTWHPVGSIEKKTQFNDQPEDFQNVLDQTMDLLNQQGLQPSSGRFFGYVPGGSLPAAAFGDFLAAFTNKYSAIYGVSPGASEIENHIIRWLIQITNMGPNCWGTLQSGASLSAVSAFNVAREQLAYEDWPKAVVYLTGQTHHSLVKSLKTIGMGRCRFESVEADESFRMKPAKLKEAIEINKKEGLVPWMVIANAGTTNTGAVDPIDEISTICKKNNVWLHVDAAYGGFFILTDRGKRILNGIDQADSLVLDPHKGLFMPYGVGAVLIKNGQLLRKCFAADADYIHDSKQDNYPSAADYSPELTKHFRALRIWFSLRVHGTDCFVKALDEKLDLAEYAYKKLSANDQIELFERPQLSSVAFCSKYGDKATQEILDQILKRGQVHVSSTVLHDKLYLRICILGFRSHKKDIDTVIEEINECSKNHEHFAKAS